MNNTLLNDTFVIICPNYRKQNNPKDNDKCIAKTVTPGLEV